jgi:hypothetical protein
MAPPGPRTAMPADSSRLDKEAKLTINVMPAHQPQVDSIDYIFFDSLH